MHRFESREQAEEESMSEAGEAADEAPPTQTLHHPPPTSVRLLQPNSHQAAGRWAKFFFFSVGKNKTADCSSRKDPIPLPSPSL